MCADVNFCALPSTSTRTAGLVRSTVGLGGLEVDDHSLPAADGDVRHRVVVFRERLVGVLGHLCADARAHGLPLLLGEVVQSLSRTPRRENPCRIDGALLSCRRLAVELLAIAFERRLTLAGRGELLLAIAFDRTSDTLGLDSLGSRLGLRLGLVRLDHLRLDHSTRVSREPHPLRLSCLITKLVQFRPLPPGNFHRVRTDHRCRLLLVGRVGSEGCPVRPHRRCS
eukprot:scaffold102675_cov57-Phaeocystis_antarctica.AAC.3